jgi:hypothetical protein
MKKFFVVVTISALLAFHSYAADFRITSGGNGAVTYVDFDGISRQPSGVVNVIINSVRDKPIPARKPGTFARYGRFAMSFACDKGLVRTLEMKIYDGQFALVDDIPVMSSWARPTDKLGSDDFALFCSRQTKAPPNDIKLTAKDWKNAGLEVLMRIKKHSDSI